MVERPRHRDEPGRLFLELVNTWEYFHGQISDQLRRPEAVPDWGHRIGLLSADDRASLSKRLGADPALGRRWLATLRRLRTTLRNAADTVMNGAPLDDEQISALNRLLGLRRPSPELVRRADGRYALARADLDLNEIQARLASSFVDLLIGGPLDRLRTCNNAECSFVFLDISPTGRRRWCSMRTCGNRAKVAAYQARRARASNHAAHVES